MASATEASAVLLIVVVIKVVSWSFPPLAGT